MIENRSFVEESWQSFAARLSSSVDQWKPALRLLLYKTSSCSWRLWATLAVGTALNASASFAGDRMTVEGTSIVFNTDALTAADDDTPEIIYADVNLFGDLIMNYPEVSSVIVSGAGGSTSAAYDIANKITELGLSTTARNNCSSACTIIFLAGSQRELEAGARLGFHRSSTRANDHKDFYEKNKVAAGWADEFSYAKQSYEDGQVVARNYIDYVVKRGVDLDFALRVLTYGQRDMWYPDRDTLQSAGVITGEK